MSITDEIQNEIDRQDARWGEQNHPDGTGLTGDRELSDDVRRFTDWMASTGNLTWRDILWEEVREAFAETDEDLLREELVQVAAVAANWVNAIDRRHRG